MGQFIVLPNVIYIYWRVYVCVFTLSGRKLQQSLLQLFVLNFEPGNFSRQMSSIGGIKVQR